MSADVEKGRIELRRTIGPSGELVLTTLELPEGSPPHLLVGKMGCTSHGMLNYQYSGPVPELVNPVCTPCEGPGVQLVRRFMGPGKLVLSFHNNLDREQDFWFEGWLKPQTDLEILPPARGKSKRQARLDAKKAAEDQVARDEAKKLGLPTDADEVDEEEREDDAHGTGTPPPIKRLELPGKD
jgi:hypothetical protein